MTLLVLGCGVPPAPACTPRLSGEASGQFENARFVVAYRMAPTKPKASQPLRLELGICARAAGIPVERVEVDARMPAHGHGMNYRPSVTQLTAGLFHAEGLLLHMPGAWELIIEVTADGRTDRLVTPLAVE